MVPVGRAWPEPLPWQSRWFSCFPPASGTVVPVAIENLSIFARGWSLQSLQAEAQVLAASNKRVGEKWKSISRSNWFGFYCFGHLIYVPPTKADCCASMPEDNTMQKGSDPTAGLRVEFFVALRFDNISAYKFKMLIGLTAEGEPFFFVEKQGNMSTCGRKIFLRHRGDGPDMMSLLLVCPAPPVPPAPTVLPANAVVAGNIDFLLCHQLPAADYNIPNPLTKPNQTEQYPAFWTHAQPYSIWLWMLVLFFFGWRVNKWIRH